MFTISDVTDADRRMQWAQQSTPRTVTKRGKLSAYGMACGYCYVITARRNKGCDYARLSTEAGGDGYYLKYYATLNGMRTRAFLHVESKVRLDRVYSAMSGVMRKRGELSECELESYRFNVTSVEY